MQTHLLFLYCYIGLSLVFAETTQNNELSTLLSIKSSLIDPNNVLKDWKMPIAGIDNKLLHCNWTGVSCNVKGFVEKLDLSNMNLNGTVSDSIQDLHSLSYINICCNGFDSSLPKSFSNPTALRSIDVSQNNFVDSFPFGLGKALWLISVNASSNNFSGFLPEDLGNASLLESLDFRGSFFTGKVPSSSQ